MTFAFVITGNNNLHGDRYRTAARAAMLSVRYFHPEDRIICLCDEQTAALMTKSDKIWSGIVDEIIPCPDAEGDPTCRSRFIKTTLRRRVSGPLVYLDGDTFLLRDIAPLAACTGDLGLTADAYFTTAPGAFPDWVKPLFRKHDWMSTDRYFNSGVMFIADTPDVHRFYENWHARYNTTKASGFFQDQPAFNATIAAVRPSIVEYPESFNFICGREPRQMPSSTRVIHVIQSRRTINVPEYDSLLVELSQDFPLTVESMVQRLRMSPCQQRTRWYHIRALYLKLKDVWIRSLFSTILPDLWY
jgi:Nucleotide-diphospho-sugar transferase